MVEIKMIFIMYGRVIFDPPHFNRMRLVANSLDFDKGFIYFKYICPSLKGQQ